MVTIGSLYSGIAGLELGLLAAFAESAIPATVSWQVEIDPFCQRVLRQHFPEVHKFNDVKNVQNPPPVDIICGGFMCTDVSSAGKGAGLAEGTRSGETWRHFRRIVTELQPRAVVVENVASGAKRWLPSIVQDLRAAGYRPFAVPIGARDVGAPHRRLRVFVVAYRDELGLEVERSGRLFDGERQAFRDDADGRGSPQSGMADADGQQLREQLRRRRRTNRSDSPLAGIDSEAETPEFAMGLRAYGLPFDVAGHQWPAGRGQQQFAWEPPRSVAKEVVIHDRRAKLQAIGNAVVPQCALVVGRILIALAQQLPQFRNH